MIAKLLKWVALNGASILGIVQAVVKVAKEIITAIVNILFPIIPSAKFEAIVLKIRDAINKIDATIEKIKAWILMISIGA